MINNILATTAFATLSFSGLSNDKALESSQKAAVTEAMRAIFREPSAFIEEAADIQLAIEKDKEHSRVHIQCVSCPLTSNSFSIDHASLRFQSLTREKEEFRLNFDLVESSAVEDTPGAQVKQSWILKGTLTPLRFAIKPNHPINLDQKIPPDSLRVEACLKHLSCNDNNSYATYQLAEQAKHSFTGMQTRRPVSASQIVTESDLKREISVFRGQLVRVTLETESGIKIISNGTALSDGAIGENIAIRLKPTQIKQSESAGKTITATITSEGQASYAR